MKFTEAKLEQAVIELFEAEGYKHFYGEQIHKAMRGKMKKVKLQLDKVDI